MMKSLEYVGTMLLCMVGFMVILAGIQFLEGKVETTGAGDTLIYVITAYWAHYMIFGLVYGVYLQLRYKSMGDFSDWLFIPFMWPILFVVEAVCIIISPFFKVKKDV